jgi:hypothetical protein
MAAARALAVGAMWLLAALLGGVPARADFGGPGGILPSGTELDDQTLDRPRELFRSEAIGGRKSYLVNLGDLAFSSPSILGGVARQAGVSCNTCHVNGTGNARLYVPGLSLVPGTFDTTGALFNPKADNGVLDPVTPPSLRGARLLAPYRAVPGAQEHRGHGGAEGARPRAGGAADPGAEHARARRGSRRRPFPGRRRGARRFSRQADRGAPVLAAAEPWSLFNRQIHDAYVAALRQLNRIAVDPKLVRRRFDND